MNAYQIMEEIINVVEGRKEGESTEDMKNRLHKELVLAVDKKAAEARDKGDHKEWEKQHKKLGKLDDIQPVYNAYVRAENDKVKEACEIMQEIISTVSEDIHSAIDKDNEGSEYTSKGNSKKELHHKAAEGRRSEEIQYAEEKGKPIGKRFNDEIEYMERRNGEDTKNYKGENKTYRKQYPTSTDVRVYNKPSEFDKAFRVELAKKAGKPVKEAFSLMEEILSYATNLFELDLENKQNISPNKIRRIKKDKEGEDVEVVSVADELFPYEGNAKEQFNQKVLAKINDMIEGTGSLEDLIQFVRKGVQTKGAHEAIAEARDPITRSAVGRTLRGKESIYNKHVDDIAKYSERAKGAKGYRAQVNQERAADAEREAEAANKDLRKTRGEYLDILRKEKGLSNPQAHAVLNKAVGEALEEIKKIAEGLFIKDGRGDLLDDIDTGLGSPVKKAWANVTNTKAPSAPKASGNGEIKNKQVSMAPKKDKTLMPKQTAKQVYKQAETVKEALGLMEEIINELKDSTLRRGKNIAQSVSDEQEENIPNVTKAEDLEFVKDDIAKKKHQAAILDNKYENQVVTRAKKEEVEKKSKNKDK